MCVYTYVCMHACACVWQTRLCRDQTCGRQGCGGNLADKAVEGPDGGKQSDVSPQIRKRCAQVRNYRKVCGCVEGLEEDPLQRDAYVHV